MLERRSRNIGLVRSSQSGRPRVILYADNGTSRPHPQPQAQIPCCIPPRRLELDPLSEPLNYSLPQLSLDHFTPVLEEERRQHYLVPDVETGGSEMICICRGCTRVRDEIRRLEGGSSS